MAAENPHQARVAGGGGGYGPYFGSVPDFGEVKKGVRFSDVGRVARREGRL